MADLASIASGPASGDAPAVLLWLVSALVLALGAVCEYLRRRIAASEARCAEENAAAKDEAKAMREEARAVREQNERLYQSAIEATAEHNRNFAAVVERNTAAYNANTEAMRVHFGSDYYRVVREMRAKAEEEAVARRPSRPPTLH